MPEPRGYLAREMSATRILPREARFRKRSKQFVRQRIKTLEPAVQPELTIYYDALFRAHGPQHWWPGRTRFEVIVGAILTQNTSWSNVERAIRELRRQKLLSARAIERVPLAQLARLIRSSGYFRQKARKLKAFVQYLRKQH